MNDRHGLIFKEQLKMFHARKMRMCVVIDENDGLRKVIFVDSNELDKMKENYGDRLEAVF